MHYRVNPLPIFFPRSFGGQGDIIERWTLAHPKVYVQSNKSLALFLHTERENFLKIPSIIIIWLDKPVMTCFCLVGSARYLALRSWFCLTISWYLPLRVKTFSIYKNRKISDHNTLTLSSSLNLGYVFFHSVSKLNLVADEKKMYIIQEATIKN